jgi:hypothetical protein
MAKGLKEKRRIKGCTGLTEKRETEACMLNFRSASPAQCGRGFKQGRKSGEIWNAPGWKFRIVAAD